MADNSADFTSTATDGEEEPNPLAGVTFTLDKQQFECKGALGLLEMSELAMLEAASVHDPRSAEAAAATAAFLRTALGDEEYARFRAHTRRNKTPARVIFAVLEHLNAAMQKRMEEQADRPTQPSPGSSGGRSEPAERTSRALSLAKPGRVTVMEGDVPPEKLIAEHRKRSSAG